MKKYIFILSIIGLGLLPSCYDGNYIETGREVGKLETLTPNITDYLVTLRGNYGDLSSDFTFFQIGRSRNVSDSENLVIGQRSNDLNKDYLIGTYYYRACAIAGNDTVFAPNVESFTIDHLISMNDSQKVDGSSAYLSFTSDVESGDAVIMVSTDKEFKEYDVIRAYVNGINDGKFEYSATVEKLNPGETYYTKASIEMLLGTLESDLASFTTQGVLRMGDVTYTGWDGKNYPMIEGYDHFLANYLRGGQQVERNIEVYYSEEGWKLSYDIDSSGSGEFFGFYSYYQQDSNNEIRIQTYKYDNPVLMWGMTKPNNGEVNINFRNMLSRVVLHVSLTDDYPEDKPYIENFTISSSKLPTIAKFQVNDGGFVFDGNSFSEPFGYWNNISLAKGETVDVVVYSIPCDSDNAVATFNFANKKYQTDIEIGWKAGNTYEYSIVFANDGLSISDVIVNEWNPTDGGSITIKP